ncbi:hypothetical protein D6C86_09014 [Aureobasidium pullulans]|nr:hypothetical protein D6C88_10302 [Aureobasidium pullulans]THZ55005.1 hypothetical protein D6C86_09014 [Aureobasidium pullulans]
MQLVLLFCFVLAAHSLAIEQRSGRTNSPILGINVNALLSACQCVIFNKDLIIEDHRLKQELIINQAFCDFIVINFANLKTRVILKQVFVIQIFD